MARIVQRAEPPPDDDAPAKLTREEMHALLAVTAVNAPTPKKRAWHRARGIAIPLALAETAAYELLGGAAPYVMVAVFVAGLAWTARPLLRDDGFA